MLNYKVYFALILRYAFNKYTLQNKSSVGNERRTACGEANYFQTTHCIRTYALLHYPTQLLREMNNSW